MKRLVAKGRHGSWFIRDTDGRDYPLGTFRTTLNVALSPQPLSQLLGSYPCERMSDQK